MAKWEDAEKTLLLTNYYSKPGALILESTVSISSDKPLNRIRDASLLVGIKPLVSREWCEIEGQLLYKANSEPLNILPYRIRDNYFMCVYIHTQLISVS